MSIPTVNEMRDFLRGKPTELRVDTNNYLVCKCGIHRKTELVVGGPGCAGWKHGSHGSVASLYEGAGVTYCHAEPGQRVLDGTFVSEALEASVKGISGDDSVQRWIKKYSRGFVIAVSQYGRGYCYLVPMPGNTRSRSARILGPNCLLLDWYRVIALFGVDSSCHYKFVVVGERQVHVERAKGSEGWNSLAGCWEAGYTLTGGDFSSWHIGMTQPSVVGEVVTFVQGGIHSVEMVLSAPEREALLDTPRSRGLFDWIETVGLVRLTSRDCEWIGLTAHAKSHTPYGGSVVKSRVKLLAIVGDRALKMLLAEDVFAVDGDPGQYAAGDERCSNRKLALMAVKSGLYDRLVVDGLNRDSTAVADVVEALFGTVYLRLGMVVLRRLVKDLEVFQCITSDLRVVDDESLLVIGVGSSVERGLTSSQLERAYQLRDQGLLGS